MNKRIFAEVRRKIVSESWSGVKYGSVQEIAMTVVARVKKMLRQEEDRIEWVDWMVKSSQRHL